MICYKDITFCPYYLLCKTWQSSGCDKAATNDILNAAAEWSKSYTKDDTVLIALYTSFPECFIRWFE